MQQIVIINKNNITGNYLHGFNQEAISFLKDTKDVKLIPETWEEMLELLRPYINNDPFEYSKPINIIKPNQYNKLENDGIDVNNALFTKLNNKYYIVNNYIDYIDYTYITNNINVLYMLILSRLREK